MEYDNVMEERIDQMLAYCAEVMNSEEETTKNRLRAAELLGLAYGIFEHNEEEEVYDG